MPGARGEHSPRRVLRLPPGPSPRIRWGEGIPLQEPEAEGLVIDLRSVLFAEPTLALRLVASAVIHEAKRVPFSVIPPRHQTVRRYLARAGLGPVMGLPDASTGTDILLPITRLRSLKDVEPTAARLQAALKSDLPVTLEPGLPALVHAFSELGENACSHGRNSYGAFVMAQRFGRTRVVLAVGDLGVGIPQHLSDVLRGQVRPLPDEAQVILHALRRGMTGTDEPRGNGLPSVIENLRDLELPSAELGIWSGSGRVRVRGGERTLTRRPNVVSSYTPGAWAEIVMSSRPRRVALTVARHDADILMR